MAKQTIDINDIAELKKQLGFNESFFNMQKTIKELSNTTIIEKITRVNDTENDDIAVLFYFGVRHTAVLNLIKNKNAKNIFYANMNYTDLEVSSMLDYVLINLSLRLSWGGKSRQEFENMITAQVKTEIEKILKENEQNKPK